MPFAERLVEAVAGDALQCDRGGLEDYFASRDPEQNPWGLVVINSEQALNPESRVTLAEARDAFGLQRIRLDWQTLEIDTRTIQDTTLAFAAHLAERDVGRVRLYDSILADQPILAAAADGQQLSGWHQMCTTRMSDDPQGRRGRPGLPGAWARQPLYRRLERLRHPRLPEPHLHHRPARAPARRPPGGGAPAGAAEAPGNP